MKVKRGQAPKELQSVMASFEKGRFEGPQTMERHFSVLVLEAFALRFAAREPDRDRLLRLPDTAGMSSPSLSPRS